MNSTQLPTIFLSIGVRWTATMESPTGPITAIGNSKGEAQHQLDELLVMRSAVAFTNKCSGSR